MDAYTPEGYTNATLIVPAAVFLTAVGRMFPEIPESVLKRGAGMRIGELELSYLRGLLAEVMAGIQDSAGSLANEMARKHMESALLDAFLMALRSACRSERMRPTLRVEGRLRHLRQARNYLAEHLDNSIQLADLCGELGLSRRGVEVLFRDTLGIGPITFLRHQRLHGGRRALLAAPPMQGTVKTTALEWGFWHMGHFAREYREFFGESPSTTLSQNRGHNTLTFVGSATGRRMGCHSCAIHSTPPLECGDRVHGKPTLHEQTLAPRDNGG